MLALSIRQPYTELIMQRDRDGAAAFEIDNDHRGTLLHLRRQTQSMPTIGSNVHMVMWNNRPTPAVTAMAIAPHPATRIEPFVTLHRL